MQPVADTIANNLPRSTPEETARLIRVYNWYRLILSLALLLLFFGQWENKLVGELYPNIYFVTASAYVLFSSLTLVALGLQERPPGNVQLFLIVIVDIAVLSVLALASGGLETGLGMLMLVSVAAGSIFFVGNIATLIAAAATLAALGTTVYLSTLAERDARHFVQAGILGMLFFTTSWVFRTLSERIRRGYQLAETQLADIAKLEKINEMIVQRMRTGVIVAGADQRIRMMNESASEMLGQPQNRLQLPADLTIPMNQWLRYRQQPQRTFRIRAQGPELQARFASLQYGNSNDILVFIEDTSRITQQAQQMKLASLGRLTASIAHEIRNPLGAISHAAQLLRESPDLVEADAHLANIIQNHAVRMNGIIENVLKLSRRNTAHPERINLTEWLPGFVHDLVIAGASRAEDIHIDTPEPVFISFDPSQLTQVLTNLCDNALRHSTPLDNAASVTLHAWQDPLNGYVMLDVLDNGPGLDEEHAGQLFEPFFTTSMSGTGLGLYISRELCEFNQASLDYLRTPDGQTCFRIRFPHPDRLIALDLAGAGDAADGESPA